MPATAFLFQCRAIDPLADGRVEATATFTKPLVTLVVATTNEATVVDMSSTLPNTIVTSERSRGVETTAVTLWQLQAFGWLSTGQLHIGACPADRAN